MAFLLISQPQVPTNANTSYMYQTLYLQNTGSSYEPNSILKNIDWPWLVWLSGLSTSL